MAQLRAKQIKLNAGDLILGNSGSNILSVGGEKAVLKVLNGTVQYALQQAADVVFSSTTSLASTNVSAALDELHTDLNAASLALTTVDNAIYASLAAETTRATNAETTITNNLTTEISRATAAEASLSSMIGSANISLANAIIAETSRAVAAESSITSDLATEISRATTAEVALGTALTLAVTTEQSRATTAEVALGTALTLAVTTEQSRALAAELTVTNNLITEVSRATAAEAAIDVNLNAIEVAAGFSTTTGMYVQSTNSLTTYLVSSTSLAVADVLLDAAIATEVSRAMFMETTLQAQITNANSSLISVINAEASRAITAELSLTNGLAAEMSRALAAEGTVAAAVVTEQSRAITAETSLATSIANEASRAGSAETVITNNLNSEIIRATGAEASLATSIANEMSRALAAEATLGSGVATEMSRALAAEGVLSLAVVAEASRATAAELVLTNGLAAEISRATAAEGVLTTNLNIEVTRATAAELAITLALTTEASRAVAAEGVINGSLAALTSATNSSLTAVTSALTTEVSRAEFAESTINARLDNLTAGQVAYVPGTYAGNLGTAVVNVQSAVDALAGKVNAIGSAFEYVGSANVASIGAVLAADTGARVGDVYKVTGTGFATLAPSLGGEVVQAGDSVVFDGSVWNVLAAVDSQVFGTTGQISVTGTDQTGFNVAIDSSYIGQASINTVGTITSGVWNGTTVDVAHGGTGDTSFVANGIVLGNGTSPLTQIAAPATVLTGTFAGFLQWSGSAFTWINQAQMQAFVGATQRADDTTVVGSTVATLILSLAHPPVGAVEVFFNGLKLSAANSDYTISGQTVTMTSTSLGYTIDAGDIVDASYNYAYNT